MNANKSQQLSFDLGSDNVKSVDEIAAFLNVNCAKTLGESENWPGNVLCLLGPDDSGLNTLARQWAQANRIELRDDLSDSDIIDVRQSYAVLYTANIREDLLFALFQKCENQGAKLLLACANPPKDWVINSPDLRSRTNSLPILEVRPMSEAYFAQILMAALNQLGLKLKKTDIASIFPRELCSFGLIVQIFGHICMIASKGELLNSVRVKAILRNLAHSAMNKDLFDDNNKYESKLP